MQNESVTATKSEERIERRKASGERRGGTIIEREIDGEGESI